MSDSIPDHRVVKCYQSKFKFKSNIKQRVKCEKHFVNICVFFIIVSIHDIDSYVDLYHFLFNKSLKEREGESILLLYTDKDKEREREREYFAIVHCTQTKTKREREYFAIVHCTLYTVHRQRQRERESILLLYTVHCTLYVLRQSQ